MDGVMNSNNTVRDKVTVHFLLSFRQLCLVTVSLPLGGLVLCFITAYIFQPDEIHETHCRVYNIIPSISAITGVSPQRYLWRICVAFHIGPRMLIASIYYAYYSKLLESMGSGVNKLLHFCYWLNIIEIASLCGVTYISNKENYPVHEKIFIVFMLCSLSYMLATLKVYRLAHPNMANTEKASYLVKKCLFVISILSTVGLLIFFAKHRLLCHEMETRLRAARSRNRLTEGRCTWWHSGCRTIQFEAMSKQANASLAVGSFSGSTEATLSSPSSIC